MSKPIVTKQDLINADVCTKQVELFEKTFGDSVIVTISHAKKVSNLFDWDCAVQLLDAQGRAECERDTTPAWVEYMCVEATAMAEYERVKATAMAEYERVKATAWATAFINTHKRGASHES